MRKTQMQITLSERFMNALRTKAAQCDVSPNVLAKIWLCSLIPGNEPEATEKYYVTKIENWREAEAYAKVKHGSKIGDFIEKIVASEMKRCPLQKAQKEEFDRLLGK